MGRSSSRSDPPQLERDPLLASRGLPHAFTGRGGGVSRGPYSSLNLGLHVGDDAGAVRENRRRALAALGLDPGRLILGEQVHGGRVRYVGAAEEGTGALEATDGLVTGTAGIVLGVLVADCIPLLLADPEAGLVAAVHAGWRGTIEEITTRAVQVMASRGAAPGRILAAMGPSIGPCCYRVSAELAARFARRFGDEVVAAGPDGPHLDLRRANRSLLLENGVPPAQISWEPACTACSGGRYFSHRAQNGRAGRQAGLIWLPA